MNELLPDHLKANQHGGKREGAGRPPVGKTKRVALTLPTDLWDKIEADREEEGISLAAFLRDIVEHYYIPTKKEREN